MGTLGILPRRRGDRLRDERVGVPGVAMTVLDLSQYDIPTFDPECMKAAGVGGVILGVFSGADSPEGMAGVAQGCVDAGLPILGFYGLIYFGSPYGETRDTRYAIDLAKRFGVERVWLDCEIDGNAIGFTDATSPTPFGRVAAIRTCVEMVEREGLKAGIYSGAWWWPSKTDNSREFSRLPLWHAAYLDNAGTPYAVQQVNYGGWSDVALHQWTSTLPVCGRNRDANHVWDSSIWGEEMPDPRVDKIIAALGGEAVIDRWNQNGNSLFGGYALEQGEQNELESRVAAIEERLKNLAAGGGGIAPGTRLTVEVLP